LLKFITLQAIINKHWNINKALMRSKVIHGEEHPYLANSYNDISGICLSLDAHDKVLENYNYALMIFKKIYSEEDSNTAILYGNIGMCYRKLGDKEKSLQFYNKSLEIRIKIYGKDHPYTKTTLSRIQGLEG